MWRELAKIAEKYVHKGDKLYIEGRIRYRYYDDKKGQRRFVAEIYAENMELLTSRQQSQQNVATGTNNATATGVTTATQQLRTTIKDNSNDDALPF